MTARPAPRRRPAAVPPEALVLGLCHEVGNLLAATRLGAHLVARGLALPDARATAAQIEAEAARGGAFLGMIRPLLAVGEQRRLRIAPGEVLAALERSLGAASDGPPQLDFRRPRAVPDVRVDPDALHHVLVALALAAADVTPRDRHVTVSAVREADSVAFVLRDEGGRLEASPPRGVAPRRGRPLVMAAAAAVLRGQGGRLESAPVKGGVRVRVVLPGCRSERRPTTPRAAPAPPRSRPARRT